MAPQDGTDPAHPWTPMPPDDDGRDLLGMMVDARYRLDAVLGRGGMGLVFRATHLELHREVAVKVLHPSLATSPEVRSRFEREALAVGKVNHPNCVATFDVGRLADESLYLAMELLEGRALVDVLARDGQFPPARALHVLRHILRGLTSIHNAGLIHRDIKPENIFLVRYGDDADFAKILDFGIAKPIFGELADDGVRLTQAGMAFGTPIYMSPEQALGSKLDGRADLYAAAVIGYEMLAGQLPFYSEDRLEVMAMHAAKPVPAMSARLIDGGRPVPPSIERLIAKGLTKKADDRYANAEEFLAAVEAELPTLDRSVAEVNSEHRVAPDLQPLGDIAQMPPGGETAHAIDDGLLQAPVTAPTPQAQPVLASPARELKTGISGAEVPAAPRPALRWPAYAAILSGAIAVGVVAAFLTVPTRRSDSAPMVVIPTPPSHAETANHALDRGDPASAAKILDEAKPAVANDPQALLTLGHARAAMHQNADSLAAYDAALSQEPSLSTNATFRANLRAIAADSDPEMVTKALDMWVGRTNDPEAKEAVLKAIVSGSLERRRAAKPVVDRNKLTNEVDWITSYGLDLEQEPTCNKRREAVAHLRALAIPAAAAPLERAVRKRMRRRNACLLAEAQAAIRVLKRRPTARK